MLFDVGFRCRPEIDARKLHCSVEFISVNYYIYMLLSDWGSICVFALPESKTMGHAVEQSHRMSVDVFSDMMVCIILNV